MAICRKLFALLFILAPGILMAQWEPDPVPDTLLKSIEEDIWIPFMESYRDYDAEKIMSIHTKDIIRVSEKNGTIDSGQPYINAFGQAVGHWQEEGRIMRISFSIINTSYGMNLVSQRGYYKISAQGPGEEAITTKGYSEFAVLLRNEGGHWKFAIDTDRKVEITEEDFQSSGLVYQITEN